MLCTMQGDVWHVEGLDATLGQVRWRRFASGLHQALGLVVADGLVHVLGREPDHPAARSERRRRGRLLRMRVQRLRDLAGRSRLHQRTPARCRGQLLHRFRQTGSAADWTRRQAGRGRGHGLSQSGWTGALLRRRPNRAQFRGGLGAGVNDLRGPSWRLLRLRRTAQWPTSGPSARLSAARAGQLERCAGGSDLRSLGTVEGSMDSLLIRCGYPFLGPA